MGSYIIKTAGNPCQPEGLEILGRYVGQVITSHWEIAISLDMVITLATFGDQ